MPWLKYTHRKTNQVLTKETINTVNVEDINFASLNDSLKVTKTYNIFDSLDTLSADLGCSKTTDVIDNPTWELQLKDRWVTFYGYKNVEEIEKDMSNIFNDLYIYDIRSVNCP